MNGVEVADSPFPVFASIHPNQLGKPVRVITGLHNFPTGIACTSDEKIVVSEYHGDVCCWIRRGIGWQVSRNLDHIRGVAVDGDGDIYFIELCENIIYKSDQQMKKIISKTTNQKGEPGHWSVAVVGDEVMVCDTRGNINVYSKELEYLRQIAGTFVGMSSDEHGNLYIYDYYNSSITVFKNGGQFLRSFDFDEDGVKKLNNPQGVCVSGQYVYVSNWWGNEISVFTTQGQYVNSFGQKGRGEGGGFLPPWNCGYRWLFVCL